MIDEGRAEIKSSFFCAWDLVSGVPFFHSLFCGCREAIIHAVLIDRANVDTNMKMAHHKS